VAVKADASGLEFASVYAARIYRNIDQSVPKLVTTVLVFTTAVRNDGELWSAVSPTRLTAPVAGWYQILGSARWDASSAGTRSLSIRVNGDAILAEVVQLGNGNGLAQNVITLYYLSAGGYVELCAYQDSGASRVIQNVAQYSPEFMMVKVG